MIQKHPYIDKYNPATYEPEVYNFLADFSTEELKEIRHELDSSSAEQFSSKMYILTQAVHQKYTYKNRKTGNLSLDKETVNKGIIGCYGLAIALSQLLQFFNITHHIAFANTHSFILAHDDQHDRYLLDALSPEITGKLNIDDICQPSSTDSNILALDIPSYIAKHKGCFDKERFLSTHPWTHFSRPQDNLPSFNYDRHQLSKNSIIYARLFSPADGIRALYAYDQYQCAIELKQRSTAYFLSKVLADSFPEVDIRNSPKLSEQLITQFGEIGLTTLAAKTIDRTAKARQVAQTIAQQIWRADQYKKLYKTTKNPEHKLKAIETLKNLNSRPNLSPQQKGLIAAKLSKLMGIA